MAALKDKRSTARQDHVASAPLDWFLGGWACEAVVTESVWDEFNVRAARASCCMASSVWWNRMASANYASKATNRCKQTEHERTAQERCIHDWTSENKLAAAVRTVVLDEHASVRDKCGLEKCVICKS